MMSRLRQSDRSGRKSELDPVHFRTSKTANNAFSATANGGGDNQEGLSVYYSFVLGAKARFL